MGAGLFVNDLFNGEALGGPWIESDRGIFRANLFDSQPLGQTTPDSGGKTATRTAADKDSAAAPSGSGATREMLPKAELIDLLRRDAAATARQAAAPASGEGGSGETGEFPWLPVALVGGGLVLTVGAILLFTGKKKAPVTSNKRRRARR